MINWTITFDVPIYTNKLIYDIFTIYKKIVYQYIIQYQYMLSPAVSIICKIL